MKKHLPALGAIALGLLTAGCAGSHNTATTSPAPADTDLRAVLDLRRKGKISDTQAIEMIAALRHVDMTPAMPPVAPAPAAVVAPVAPRMNTAPITPAPAPSANTVQRAPLTGRLRSIGSDSMDVIMDGWTKLFSQQHPALRVTHEGKGSSTAVPALLEGRADIGPMSRPLKAEEIAKFEQKFGYAPTQIRTAVDALAIYVHPSNPILKAGLTLRQLDAVFSATRKRGGAAVTTWGDLGLTGEWKDAPVRVYSRNSASGTYGFFRDEVLSKGEFREDARPLPGSAELVAAVAADKFAIGYSGIGYKTDAVATAPVAKDEKSGFKEPSEGNALSGAYPIARGLFVTINRDPARPTSDMHREFIRFILSPEGQDIVRRDGYFAVPAKDLPSELAKVDSVKM